VTQGYPSYCSSSLLYFCYKSILLTEKEATFMNNAFLPNMTTRDTAPAYWLGNILWIMLATYETTNGEYSLIEELIPSGLAAPPHIHEAADEAFYVLEGEATFMLSEQPLHASAGSLISIPRRTKHAFQINTDTARLLNWYYPAGFEHAIIIAAQQTQERTLPPATFPPLDMQRQQQLMQEVMKQYPAARTTYLG
jgi:quercetin dioxygenase-like cupin family protein